MRQGSDRDGTKVKDVLSATNKRDHCPMSAVERHRSRPSMAALARSHSDPGVSRSQTRNFGFTSHVLAEDSRAYQAVRPLPKPQRQSASDHHDRRRACWQWSIARGLQGAWNSSHDLSVQLHCRHSSPILVAASECGGETPRETQAVTEYGEVVEAFGTWVSTACRN